MKRKPQDLTALLIAYDESRRRLDRIQNDPEYIKAKTAQVFKNHTPRDYTAEIKALFETL